MRQLVDRFLKSDLSRRGFVERMVGLGFTAAAAQSVLAPLEASESAAVGHDMPGVGKVSGTGGETVIAQMKAAGLKYLFTNPGSFEVGFFDAFSDQTDMQLIMGLHEGIVISMADGYHRVTQQPSFVNVHVIAGTAQAAGQMYNASRDGSSIVVTAGMNDNELWSDEAGLAPRPGFDQKDVNRQFTKISWESRDARSLALMVRRALKVAATEPGGPVYLAMAQHALEAKGIEATILPAERFLFRGKVRPLGRGRREGGKAFDRGEESRRGRRRRSLEVRRSGRNGRLLRETRTPGHLQPPGIPELPGAAPAVRRTLPARVRAAKTRRGLDSLDWIVRLRWLQGSERPGGSLWRALRANRNRHVAHGAQLSHRRRGRGRCQGIAQRPQRGP